MTLIARSSTARILGRQLSVCMLALSALLMFSSASHAFDIGDLSKQIEGDGASAPADLLSSLTDQLGISSEQAAGGTSALVALAANQLSDDDSSLLSGIIPTDGGGLTSQLVNQVTNMESVKAIFGKLGMDPALVSQFAPVLIDYVGANGGTELIGKLGQLWSPGD